MTILAVGSVAYDSVETPFGACERALGGSAVYFSLAASLFAEVRLVGVVGEDFEERHVALLRDRGVDMAGLERASGRTFRWSGRYGYDLNTRETLSTELNVFERFRPEIPETFLDSQIVFLGNIDPVLQLDVLRQVPAAKLSACDTMNFWIESQRTELERLLARVDVLIINDEEARQLSQSPNLWRAAERIRAAGPGHVVIKKGEHGALLFGPDGIFSAPGLPLEEIVDPTGAGDAFAGGFLGYLAERSGSGGGARGPSQHAVGNRSAEGRRGPAVVNGSTKLGGPRSLEYRRAVIYGCVLGSFCVEAFGVERLTTLTRDEVEVRFEAFLRIMQLNDEQTPSGDG